MNWQIPLFSAMVFPEISKVAFITLEKIKQVQKVRDVMNVLSLYSQYISTSYYCFITY